ncbi:hypothetical protein [Arthrobacter globiformis]|nr:hypothetical protein [Arthrobacter globiformis]MDQ0864813.1 hypothetical protein [Arthrobacter globiformis]
MAAIDVFIASTGQAGVVGRLLHAAEMLIEAADDTSLKAQLAA